MSDLRALLHQVVDALVDRLEAPRAGTADDGWYDQDNSPLPRAAHLKAVRRGWLVGYRVRGRVLVEKAVMHAYIKSGGATADDVDDAGDEELPSEDEAVAAALGKLRKAS